ncbi:MAG: hypothetical protein HY873_14585 [Chloroflexi bacterium]|nr:hypothetical protein [Chloroflexota bacterium]
MTTRFLIGPGAHRTVSIVHLCPACEARYVTGSICDACLRDADTDAPRKRAILFPADFADLR